jgi:hypothetical protein
LNTLAAAYAEAGKFAQAVDTSAKALSLAESQNKPLASGIRKQLAAYKSGKAHRSGP